MKILTLFLICVFLVQCTNGERQSSKNTNSKIDVQLVQKIQDYYLDGEGAGLKNEINDHDSLNEMVFWEDEGFTLMRILVPKEIDEDSPEILFPDFNQDGLEDIIIEVYREGGWGGGNVYDREIFVFKNQENDFELKSVNNSKNLTDCTSGQFALEGLKDGKLIGTSYCYAPEDGHCCPSLKYNTILHEEDWKLKHLSSEKK